MKENYYIGLDVGTNSVGYAVTDKSYNLLKYKGEPMWGSHVFDEGKQSAERRSFRTARRRLNRRQQRIHLTQEIFAKAIGEIDSRFFIRLKESALFKEDKSGNDKFVLFQDENYTDKDFYKDYPTIHHLILKLMESDEPADVRLVYIAVAWLMAHRGHFLSNVDKDKVSDLLEFDPIYDNFMDFFEKKPWVLDDKESFKNILIENQTVSKKDEKFKKLLFDDKDPKDGEEDYISKEAILKLLSGGTIEFSKIFLKDEFEEEKKISLTKSEEDFVDALSILDKEQADFLIRIRALYDWALLAVTLQNSQTLSEAKVAIYNQHKEDLKNLKYLVHKYCPDKFNEIFKDVLANNYAAYVYNIPTAKRTEACKHKATPQTFCDFLKNILKNISCDEIDEEMYQDIMLRLKTYTFMPKQVTGDNRVIPYQLYYYELKKVLDNAEKYLDFLSEKDESGISNKDKLLSIFTFRIPYFVGPLCEASDFAWLKRKAEGKIYPWNFEEMVDFDSSEDAFINRMTNSCTYLPGETVLPANSLLYKKFTVLNEINNIKINGNEISPECKQEIYSLFEEKGNKTLTVAKIKKSLISNGYMTSEDTLSGIDVKINSNLKSFHDFYRLLKNKSLNEKGVERIIEIITYSEDKNRVIKRIEKEFPTLSKEDVKYISKLKYKGFGRISRKFLTEIEGINRETGECYNILNALWETNDNLMQLLSNNYTFEKELKKLQDEYYRENPKDIESILEDMYISNAVKRPIYRALDVLNDIKHACKNPPDKIFIEMARGAEEKSRTVSRKKKIEDYYKNFPQNEVRELQKQLETFEERDLRDDKLFLYFMQLGKSMYSGKVIDIERLNSKEYDIDHIYPQCKVKDDSFSNKVLVLTTENEAKKNKYPISSDIREKMTPMWRIYQKHGLITEEKYKRLTRATQFSEKECWDFINRQLVETRQATKALTRILKLVFPEVEIVFVKSRLVSDFRNEVLEVKKSRSINDLHHAKDAYLNIVAGDVYDARFTKNYFNLDQEYSVKLETIFEHDVYRGKEKVWNGKDDIQRIKKIHSKNNIHYTRYAFERKGGLFDQQPSRQSEGLVELKSGLDTKKYGGYKKPTATYYLLAKYTLNEKKQKQDIMFVPVDLMSSKRIKKDEAYLFEYVKSAIAKIIGKDKGKIENISFPIGTRKIKINTLLSLDGVLLAISGKDSCGKQILVKSMLPLILDSKKENYIKYLENFSKKSKQIKSLKVDSEYDKITKEENNELYDFFVEKAQSKPFSILLPSKPIEPLINGKSKFEKLEIENQVETLLNILFLFKTGRSTTCDLSSIGGGKKVALLRRNSVLSNLKKYEDIRVIDVSPAGLHMKKSENLLELI